MAELSKAQAGNNAVSYEAIGDVINELTTGQSNSDFTKSLLNFVDGDLKVSYTKDKSSEEANKDLSSVVVSDVALDMEEFSLRNIDQVKMEAELEKRRAP